MSPPKVVQSPADVETERFWAEARKVSAEVATWPWWKRGTEPPASELPVIEDEPRSSLVCEHANEVPGGACPCPPGCACERDGACMGRVRGSADERGGDHG